MTYEKDPFDFENIPDFAMQPARGAEEYNDKPPREANKRYDASVYEKILHQPAKYPLNEEKKEVQPVIEEEELVEETGTEQEELAQETGMELEELTQETGMELEELAQETGIELEESSEEVATELVPEEIPVFQPSTVPEPQPVLAPGPQTVPPPKVVPIKVIPVFGSLISSKLKLVDIKKKPQIRIFIEEDILVPDVKPDLASIISMDGNIKLSEKEIHTSQFDTDTIKITGDLIIQTLYIPEIVDGEPMVAIESRLPFKNETEIKTGPYSDLMVTPIIESIDYTVVNERKFKVKATVALGLREYSNMDIEIFEGIRDEEVQMLKEKIQLTDVALRKTETAEIKEDLMLKDTMPEIQKILKYDVNVVENHKQITKEKAVINASVYCNIMYLGTDAATEINKSEIEDNNNEGAIPVLYQGKTEFTQFIRLDNDNSHVSQNPAGSKVNFHIASLNLNVKEDGNGKNNIFELDMNVETGLELYKNIDKEVVTDVYHHLKDIQYETDEIGLMALSGSGVAEVSVREIINVPERHGNVDRIAYISGKVSEKSAYIEQGKSNVEGNVTIGLICISADEKKSTFNIKQEIPFRSSMEIPGITPEMVADNDIILKDLWFDKINNRQIEVNAGIVVNTAISSQEKHQLVKNISFLENAQEIQNSPGIIVYITRVGDNIWKIAKKYRTTIDEIKRVNELDYSKDIKPGTKLLIVAKGH